MFERQIEVSEETGWVYCQVYKLVWARSSQDPDFHFERLDWIVQPVAHPGFLKNLVKSHVLCEIR